MEHIIAGHMVVTSRIDMTRSEMADSWIHLIDEQVDMGIILVLVQTSITVIIVIIFTRGVTGDICWMTQRKQSHLHLMEK